MSDYLNDDLGGCPYYARYYSLAGHDPEGTCMAHCFEEPSCVTDEPEGGWDEPPHLPRTEP